MGTAVMASATPQNSAYTLAGIEPAKVAAE
jgi:hypothetical protein